ncbi:TATA-box binding protein [Natranaerovirga hydrolytica]|uniref:TATA-box binding protein n=1 Tax=Natranaerovirga hydrolytica TaxID=680378 RepID=A0A4R1M7J0_9FIRM|nr:YwmB family TATA-box binding protein [Natranaerovirga hydrolytica]TCK87895.1 TATA-box binding protein [Natranaerovirga hydrolytica]
MDKKQALYVVFIVMLVVIYQYSGNLFINGEKELVQAFNNTTFNIQESNITVWGLYSNNYMSRENKVEVLNDIAKEISLEPEYEYNIVNEGSFQEAQLIKQSKNARTSIKIVSMERELEGNLKEVENFLIVDIKFMNNIHSALHYKELLTNLFNEKALDMQVTMHFVGEHDGFLSEEKKESISNDLLKAINAREQERFVTNEIYSIYGYTSTIKDYILSNNKRINVDIAITYNEEEDKSILYIATPLITMPY